MEPIPAIDGFLKKPKARRDSIKNPKASGPKAKSLSELKPNGDQVRCRLKRIMDLVVEEADAQGITPTELLGILLHKFSTITKTTKI